MVGSSRKRIRGLCSSARATSSRRFIPPEYSFTKFFFRSESPTNSTSISMRFSRSARGTPYKNSVQIHVFKGRQLVVEAGVLKNDSKRPPYLLLLARRIVPVHSNRSAGGIEHRRQHLDRGRLSRPVRAEKTKYLPLWHRKCNVIHRAEIPIILHKIVHNDHFTHSSFFPVIRLAAHRKSGETGYAVYCGSINRDIAASNEIPWFVLSRAVFAEADCRNSPPWRSEDYRVRTRREQVLKAFDGWASDSGG